MKKRVFQIGIIGFGRFGRPLAEILKKDFKLLVFSKPKPKSIPKDTRIKLGSLKEVANCPVIILTVPISAFGVVLKELKPNLKKDNLIVDVCSVKKYPVALMKKTLPKNIEILAVHPMFGLTGHKGTLRGLKITIWPVRVKKEKYQKIKKWLKKKQLKVIEIAPDEHDRLAARSQALSHFIARSLELMKISATKIDTLNFKRILESKEAVSKDSWQLSKDIHRFNPYAKKARQEFARALQRTEKMIRKN